MRLPLIALMLSCCMPLAAAQGDPPPAEVVVLATLHTMHADVPAYSEQVLADSIVRLAPDVLCLEVRPDRYAAKAPETNKVEYPNVVYPLVEARGDRVYPMEPAPPLFDEIVGPYVAAARAFGEARPEAWAAFGNYTSSMYAALRTYWTTPARVNDEVTDAQMRAKHALQVGLMGEGERAGWEAWNLQFLSVIKRAAAENPGKRVVVLVGAEHGYWLRDALARQPGIRVLGAAALLSASARAHAGD